MESLLTEELKRQIVSGYTRKCTRMYELKEKLANPTDNEIRRMFGILSMSHFNSMVEIGKNNYPYKMMYKE